MSFITTIELVDEKMYTHSFAQKILTSIRHVETFPSLPTTCSVHKHQLCDKVLDCEESSEDETSELCREQLNEGCYRRVNNWEQLLPLPISWIGDGIEDCLDGIDEDESKWPSCDYGAFNRVVLQVSFCDDIYICRNSHAKYISFMYLCDRLNTCSNENDVCKASHDVTEPLPNSIILEQKNYMSYCLPGLMRSVAEKTEGCSEVSFPDIQILGTTSNSLIVPNDKKDCSYFYGEIYLFLACSGRCFDTACPVRRLLSHDSCRFQLRHRVFSLAAGKLLTLVKHSEQGFRVLDLFECQNGRCIPYSDVCNLIDDCGDQSDELICQNNFVCNSNSAGQTTSFIPKNRKCDGSIDCGDFSEECNEMCNKSVIKGVSLKVSSFIIGILSLILNFATVSKNIKSLGRVRTINVLQNRVLIILIGVGDGMVGGYLIAIAVIDRHYGNSYCEAQFSWLISPSCSNLGFVSTLGSQISLLSMTVLSLVRSTDITKSISIPLSVNKKGVVKVVAIAALLTVASTAIAILPLLSVFQDAFVNAVHFPDNPLFIGFVSKTVLLKVVSKYYGGKKYFSVDATWRNILNLVKSMFTNQYNGVKFHLLNFYGNDAVCLFKFFVQPDDPQALFSWSILGADFTCFLIISLSYLCVFTNTVTVRSSSVLKQSSNNVIKNRNIKLQRKISMIIATDFLCWIPFIMISLLHTLRVMDAAPWYGLFSIVILPINSVINPLLYDDLIFVSARSIYLKIKTRLSIQPKSLVSTNDIMASTTC